MRQIALLIALFAPVAVSAQIPGSPELYRAAIDSSDFIAEAAQTIFARGFRTEMYAFVEPSFGIEYMVALEEEHVIVLTLDAPLEQTGFVPCPGAPQCHTWSREAAFRARARLDTLTLGAWSSDVLRTLWYEALARAPVRRRDNAVAVDGTTYLFRAGDLMAEAWSPRRPSLALALVQFVELLRDAPSAPDPRQARAHIRNVADSLLAAVLGHGAEEPLTSIREMPYPRALRSCADTPPPVPYLYCWQADLDADPYPEWIVATREDTTYTYRILDTIIDPASRPYVRTLSGIVPQWAIEEGEAYHLLGPPMRPWEIVDLSRAVRPNRLALFAGVRRINGRVKVGLEFAGGQGRVSAAGSDDWHTRLGWRTLDELFEQAEH